MWLEIGDRVSNQSGRTGVVVEVNDANAKVEFDDGHGQGWFACGEEDGPLN